MRRRFRLTAIVMTLAVLLAACSGDDSTGSAATGPSPSTRTLGFGVGMRSDELVDSSRGTPASQGQRATDERVLDTVIWYPTHGDPAAGPEEDAEPATDRGPYPLIVFSHGYGGSPENIEDIADDWVRAGFVVAAPNFPLSRADHRGGPDATDVENQAGDVSFLISALTDDLDDDSPLVGLIDGEHIGAAGHSLGAITTLGVTTNTCCADDRIDAVVEMSGTFVAFSGGEYDLSRMPPLLVVHGTDDELVDYADALTVFDRVEPPKGLLTIDGGTHDSWLEHDADGHDAVARVTADFFLAYLTDDEDALGRLASEETEADAVTLQFVAGEPSTGGRLATAGPTRGLTAGQLVTVTWSGFTPGGTINVVQCSRGGSADGSDCALSAGAVGRDDPTGSGTFVLPVVVGAVGRGRCEAGATGCVILVNDSGLTEPEATILIPLSFAP